MAPSTGENNAMMSPAAAVAKPHIDWPSTGSDASRVAKYGPKTNVVTSVKKGCVAQSKNTQLTTAAREGY